MMTSKCLIAVQTFLAGGKEAELHFQADFLRQESGSLMLYSRPAPQEPEQLVMAFAAGFWRAAWVIDPQTKLPQGLQPRQASGFISEPSADPSIEQLAQHSAPSTTSQPTQATRVTKSTKATQATATTSASSITADPAEKRVQGHQSEQGELDQDPSKEQTQEQSDQKQSDEPHAISAADAQLFAHDIDLHKPTFKDSTDQKVDQRIDQQAQPQMHQQIDHPASSPSQPSLVSELETTPEAWPSSYGSSATSTAPASSTIDSHAEPSDELQEQIKLPGHFPEDVSDPSSQETAEPVKETAEPTVFSAEPPPIDSFQASPTPKTSEDQTLQGTLTNTPIASSENATIDASAKTAQDTASIANEPTEEAPDLSFDEAIDAEESAPSFENDSFNNTVAPQSFPPEPLWNDLDKEERAERVARLLSRTAFISIAQLSELLSASDSEIAAALFAAISQRKVTVDQVAHEETQKLLDHWMPLIRPADATLKPAEMLHQLSQTPETSHVDAIQLRVWLSRNPQSKS